MASGASHNIAVSDDQNVLTFGSGEQGQLGVDSLQVGLPVPVSPFLVVTVRLGLGFTVRGIH
jgi:alpha-tubulin suppressor-like RCC1 family protein